MHAQSEKLTPTNSQAIRSPQAINTEETIRGIIGHYKSQNETPNSLLKALPRRDFNLSERFDILLEKSRSNTVTHKYKKHIAQNKNSNIENRR